MIAVKARHFASCRRRGPFGFGLARALPPLLLLAAAGCRDVTGPRPLNIAIVVTQVSAPVFSTAPDSTPRITCTIDLSATASGSGSATWFDGKILWYTGPTRSAPTDSATLSLTQMQSSWGSAVINAGQTLASSWYVYESAPFHAVMEYSYEPANAAKQTAKVEFDCGPKVEPGTPAPSINTIVVQHDAADVQPSDTLTVDYAVTSAEGVWETAVDLSGPCAVQKTVAGHLQTALDDTVRIPIPAACQLGIPLAVTVYARDAALQVSSRSLATQISLVDKTPPYLLAMFYPPHNSGPLTSTLSGFAFGGDTIETYVVAADNHILHSVNWNVLPAGAGVDDSLVVDSEGTTGMVDIRFQRGASGPVQLRVYARDAVGNVSDTVTTPMGPFYLYPSVVLPADSATVDGYTPDAIPDPKRQLAYLLQPNDNRILVLSLSTMTVTQTIPYSWVATDFDITPGGDSLLVALRGGNALGVVDLRQSPLSMSILPLDPVDSTGPPSPHFVRTLSNGKTFVTLYNSDLLDEIDLATGAQRVRRDAGVNGNVGLAALGRSLNHAVVVVNGGAGYFQRYDVSTDHFGPLLSPAAGGASLDSAGQHVAAGLTVYDSALQPVSTAAAGWPIPGIWPTIISPDGTMLFQVLPDGVVRNRVADGAIVDRIINPIIGAAGNPRISDDGTLLMTTQAGLSGYNKVSVIHLH